MTLTSIQSRTSYPGAGLTGPFAYPFKIFSAGDLLVTKRSALGVETPLVLTTDYTVTGVGDATGNLNLTTALVVGETLVIRRATANTQPMSIRNQGAYFPATIEDEFDRMAMQILALQDQVDRSVKLQETLSPSAFTTTLPTPTAGKVVTGTGTGFTMSTLDSSAVALPGAGRTVTTLSAYLANNATFNVLDYGAVGNGATDDSAKIQAAINAAVAAGAAVRFPSVSSAGYAIGTNVVVTGPVRLYGDGRAKSNIITLGCSGVLVSAAVAFFEIYDMTIAASVRYTTTPNAFYGIKNLSTTAQQGYRHAYVNVLLDGYRDSLIADGVCSSVFDNVEAVQCKYGLSAGQITLNNSLVSCRFSSNGAVAGSVGITIGDGTDAEGWMITDVLCDSFDYAVYLNAASWCKLHNNIFDHCRLFGVVITSGVSCAVGSNISDTYIGLTGTTDTGIFMNNNVAPPARQNMGNVIESNTILTYVGSTSVNGILVAGSQESNHIIRHNRVFGGSTSDCRVSAGTGIIVTHNIWLNLGFYGGVRVYYDGNQGPIITGVDTTVLQSPFLTVETIVPYAAAITPDINFGNAFDITATNGTAFTINAPTNPPTQGNKRITLTIRNTSGGALGVATFNAIYKMSAWVQPANGFSRSIDFKWRQGANWVEVSRTPADVPN